MEKDHKLVDVCVRGEKVGVGLVYEKEDIKYERPDLSNYSGVKKVYKLLEAKYN